MTNFTRRCPVNLHSGSINAHCYQQWIKVSFKIHACLIPTLGVIGLLDFWQINSRVNLMYQQFWAFFTYLIIICFIYCKKTVHLLDVGSHLVVFFHPLESILYIFRRLTMAISRVKKDNLLVSAGCFHKVLFLILAYFIQTTLPIYG